MRPSHIPMHIPDGFLSVLVSLICWALSAGVLAFALARVRKELGERQVPLMGVLAAVIFAGQMLNFAVSGGTSGHLLGAALAAIVLGPWAAVVVITSVVSVQALIFQDGGLLALGANIFNMAVVGVLTAWGVYRLLRRFLPDAKWSLLLAAFLSAWVSIEVASLAAALQLSLSGTSPAGISIPAMAGIHALIGVGEGLITTGAVAFLLAARPQLLRSDAKESTSSWLVWAGGLAIAVILAVISPLASANPDGLEWVAEQTGFLNLAQEPAYAIIPDYVVPGIENETLATILAGIIGLLLVAGVAWVASRIRRTTVQG